jgi:hypothetical protein
MVSSKNPSLKPGLQLQAEALRRLHAFFRIERQNGIIGL